MVTESQPSYWPEPQSSFRTILGAMPLFHRLCREHDSRDIRLNDQRATIINAVVAAQLMRETIVSKLPENMDVGKRAAAEGFLTKLGHDVSQMLLELGLPGELLKTACEDEV